MNKFLSASGGHFDGDIQVCVNYKGNEWIIEYEITDNTGKILKSTHVHCSDLNLGIADIIGSTIENICWSLEDEKK